MNNIRYPMLIALTLMSLTGIASGTPSTADLGRELCRVMSEHVPQFTLVQADEKPTASVDGHKGYRIVLRRGNVVDLNPVQRIPIGEPVKTAPQLVTLWSHIDLVLIPDTDRVSAGLRNRIKWQELGQEYYVKPVYMGKGRGFHWFAKTTIF